MKTLLALLLIAAVAFAQQEECESTSVYDGESDVLARAGYHLDFEVAKGDTDGVYIRIDLSEQFDDDDNFPTNRSLWIQLDPRSTASGASWNVTARGDSKPDATSPVLMDGIIVGSEYAWFDLGAGHEYVWINIRFSCSSCISTAEFAVETAVTIGHTFVYTTHQLLNQTRTIGWATRTVPDASHTNWVYFIYNFTDSDLVSGSRSIYFDLTYEDLDDAAAKVVVYFQKDTPPTNETFAGKYPVNPVSGNWLQENPFVVNAGLYYFGFYTLESSTSDSFDVDWTAKVGFGDYPCSMASGVVANVLLFALIPFTVLLNKF